jgi:hypothetical protein
MPPDRGIFEDIFVSLVMLGAFAARTVPMIFPASAHEDDRLRGNGARHRGAVRPGWRSLMFLDWFDEERVATRARSPARR